MADHLRTELALHAVGMASLTRKPGSGAGSPQQSRKPAQYTAYAF
jgi:hypothetical protein